MASWEFQPPGDPSTTNYMYLHFVGPIVFMNKIIVHIML